AQDQHAVAVVGIAKCPAGRRQPRLRLLFEGQLEADDLDRQLAEHALGAGPDGRADAGMGDEEDADAHARILAGNRDSGFGIRQNRIKSNSNVSTTAFTLLLLLRIPNPESRIPNHSSSR